MILAEGARGEVGGGGGAERVRGEGNRDAAWERGPGRERGPGWDRGDAVPSRAFSRTVLATMFSSSMARSGAGGRGGPAEQPRRPHTMPGAALPRPGGAGRSGRLPPQPAASGGASPP